MTTQQDLLFELGSEELPPKNLLTLSNALLNNMLKGLDEAGLSYQDSKAYATPRRLAVLVKGLNAAQPDKTVEKRGPAVKAAFAEDGSPSKAALGFARSCGVEFDALDRLKTGKGEWLAFRQQVSGKQATELVPEIIGKSIHALPIAKRMRWGANASEFVRPVHWAVLMYGGDVIEADVLGLKTGNQTHGHRFHAPEALTISSPDAYADTLRSKGRVEADFATRMEVIRKAANEAAQKVGGIAHIEEDLLEEVASLNEHPVPVVGHFSERFLKLPKEVLITTMQSNQKYFPVVNEAGDLLSHFITFSNIDSSRPESIQHGNERVILPRLADAEFFWNQDRKQSLAARGERLETIVFQQKLGTLADKTKRLQTLAEYIANELDADSEQAKRAALLAKTDLVTDMVGEFASLQGIMGRYYALADGEAEEVAQALEEQYFPKQSGSATPASTTGQILSLADKLDTLTGIFSAGLIPTGDKDPYGLRRASLGILRIIIENRLALNIVELISFSLQQYAHEFDRGKTRSLITDFVFERLKGYCLEHGYSHDEFDAVFAIKPELPLDFIARLQAVKHFRTLPEAASLAAANKRIGNILKKSDTAPADSVGSLIESEERRLQALAEKSAADIEPLLKQGDYEAALSRLAALKEPVDNFFDNVMVNCEDLTLRANRLALLSTLSRQFLQIADISKLQ